MRIVVAPDKFKGSATAAEVAAAVGRGLQAEAPRAEIRRLPIADGGDGTLEAARCASFEPVVLTASGPTGLPGPASFAHRDGTALIEMASVCGQVRLPGGRSAPLSSSSRGLGEVIRAALEAGHRRLVVGVGGSASTDGGAGMLMALGVRIDDRDGRPIADGGAALIDAVAVDTSGLHPGVREATIVLAADVDNPLLGPDGAAAVFGPQKGANPQDVALLEQALGRWADLVTRDTGNDLRYAPGGGAAGGVGFGAMAVLGGHRRSGVEVVLELIGFDDAVRCADLVIVGEGSLDRQTLRGKAPMGAAHAARRAGAEVVAVCGRRLAGEGDLRSMGISAAYACTDLVEDPARSIADPLPVLERIGGLIARRHARIP